MAQALFSVGQEFTATRDHDMVPAGAKILVERVAEPRSGEFEYTVQYCDGQRTILQESTLRVLSGQH